jgi:fructokinase
VRSVSVGELLWDVFGQTEFLGGAPLNFSVNLQRLGNSVLLLSAVGNDLRGHRALEQMTASGLTTEFVQTVTERPTGAAEVVTDSAGNASFVFDRPAAFDLVRTDDRLLERIQAFQPDWIYYGTLAQTDARNEDILGELIRRCPDAKRFYDMNLRTGHWNLALVQRLSCLATVLKLNDAEAELLFSLTFGSTPFDLEAFCQHWSSTYGVNVICVTLGSKGCAVFIGGSLRLFPGVPVTVADTVGAGDAFAAAFLHGLHLGWPVERTARFANALGAFVASRPGATPAWTPDDIETTAYAVGIRQAFCG